MAIPRFHDERLARLPERFFLALGHLQYAYTKLEVNLACQIKHLVFAGYDPKEHRFMLGRVDAVLGGMRMDTAKDTFKRMLRVTEAPIDVIEYVNVVFAQLSEIQFFRNRLTHYHTGRWFRKRGQFVNTDLEVAREYDKAITIAFGIEAMEAARHDLHAIAYYLERSIPDEDHGLFLSRQHGSINPQC